MSLTSSAASAGSPSASSEPACEPSPSASRTSSAAPSSPSTGQASRSMMTCEPLQPTLFDGMELPSMPYAAASHARTYLELGLVRDSTESGQGSGENLPVSLANYDRATRSWKTWQLSLTTEWEPFSGTWPTSGTMRSGQLYPRAPWVRHTCDSECSQWPTPTASMDGRGFGIPLHERTGRYKKSTILRVHALVREHGWRIHPSFTEALMDFPSGWTEIGQSGTASIRASRTSLAAPSCKRDPIKLCTGRKDAVDG